MTNTSIGSTGNVKTEVENTGLQFVICPYDMTNNCYRVWVSNNNNFFYLTACNPYSGAIVINTNVQLRYLHVTLKRNY